MSIILDLLTGVLILVSLFLIFVVLMQRAKSDGGMGSAIGGGMAESAFGGETSNVLSKATINAAIAFFLLSFLLYLGNVYQRSHAAKSTIALPNIAAPAALPVVPSPTAGALPGTAVPAAKPIAPATGPTAPTAAPKNP